MNPQIQPLIKTVKGLPFPDQLQILREITKSMSVSWKKPDTQDDFWYPKTIEQHLKANPVDAVKDINDLTGDFWPEDESADDFIKYTYGQRSKDRKAG
ncbi:Uncharacterized protein dnl_21150 [Desulfonema limicola]|uniref:Uncharacterized protein n=1 Tax=Desulfonema limicola TaxID=45656 RepID=A0A975B6T2_9BACT|nr:hypothetical protein [Desulfonema limicola]QTA79833.1 Uncharacterized protein dnl_21150 [Desulfonema limicola]